MFPDFFLLSNSFKIQNKMKNKLSKLALLVLLIFCSLQAKCMCYIVYKTGEIWHEYPCFPQSRCTDQNVQAFMQWLVEQGNQNVFCQERASGPVQGNVGFADYPFDGKLLFESTDGNRRFAHGATSYVVLVRNAGAPTVIYDENARPLPTGKNLLFNHNDSLTWISYRITSFEEEMGSTKGPKTETVVHILNNGEIVAFASGQAIKVKTFAHASTEKHQVKISSIFGQVLKYTSFTGEIELPVPTAGTYLIQVDNQKAQKVIVQ